MTQIRQVTFGVSVDVTQIRQVTPGPGADVTQIRQVTFAASADVTDIRQITFALGADVMIGWPRRGLPGGFPVTEPADDTALRPPAKGELRPVLRQRQALRGDGACTNGSKTLLSELNKCTCLGIV